MTVTNIGVQSSTALRRSDGLSAIASLRHHWPEYVMEVGELETYLFATCVFATLLQHPASIVRQFISSGVARRALMGLAMGATAITAVMSPWGKRSGGHFNPAITLTFYRLGKVEFWDAWLYVIAQFLGAIGGVTLAKYVLRGALAHDAVRYAVTVPGMYGSTVAFVAELTISFILMITVLFATNHKRLAPYTAYFVGILIATYYTFEAPLSGMSTNPARTFSSALHANYWHALWIYFIAPSMGMLAAGEVFLRVRRGAAPYCAKLHHANNERCIFHHVQQTFREENPMRRLEDDYLTAYRSLKLTRDSEGVLVAEFHNNDGPFTFTAQDHTEFVDAFYRIAQDRENKVVILTGAGGEFIPEIDFSSFGNVADPGVWSQVHDEGVQILENLANIRVPMIAAIEGRAHVHSEYALLANVIVAAEGATFHDIPHFAGGIVPGDGIFTTWSYRAGAGRAEAFLLNPQPLTAHTAHEWGVVAEFVPNGMALNRARELAELYLKAPEVTRRNTRVHFIQPLKERIVREVGYGLSLEGASAADLVKSMQAKSETVAQKGKVA